MKITIELSDAEAKYFASFVILRTIKTAADAVPDDYEYYWELLEAGEKFERLRQKVVNELFATKAI